jgi:hypothetical protein
MPLMTAMLFSLLVTGCAANNIKNLVTRGTAEGGKGWGKTILLCQVALPAGSVTNPDKIKDVTTRVEQCLAKAPGVELVAVEGLRNALSGREPFGTSDAELADAALAAGADTVAVVQVMEYGGDLTISLVPPCWKVTLDYAYHARIVDAHTGALYLDAYRGQREGGTFAVRGADKLGEDFKADLAALLSDTDQDNPGKDLPAKTGSGS